MRSLRPAPPANHPLCRGPTGPLALFPGHLPAARPTENAKIAAAGPARRALPHRRHLGTERVLPTPREGLPGEIHLARPGRRPNRDRWYLRLSNTIQRVYDMNLSLSRSGQRPGTQLGKASEPAEPAAARPRTGDRIEAPGQSTLRWFRNNAGCSAVFLQYPHPLKLRDP